MTASPFPTHHADTPIPVPDNKRTEMLAIGQAHVLELLAQGQSLSEILTEITRLIESLSEGMLCSILIPSDDRRHMVHAAAPSLPEEYCRTIDDKITEPIAETYDRTKITNQMLMTADIATDPRMKDDMRALALQHGLRACWVSPIFSADDRILGTFACYYRVPREPAEDEWHLVAAATHLAGIAIERSRADAERQRIHAEALRTAERLRAVQSVTDVALAHLPVDDLLREMLARVRQIMRVDNAAILLLDGDGKDLHMRAASGPEEAVATDVHVPFGCGVAGHIAASQEPYIIDDLSQVEVWNPFLHDRLHSLVGVPLLVGERVIGVMHIGTTQPRHFTEDDVSLLQVVAQRIALAIDHAHLFEAEQRAHAEASARAQELVTTFQAMADGVMIYDARGEIISRNAAIYAMLHLNAIPNYDELSLEERSRLFRVCDGNGAPIASADLPPARVLRGEILGGAGAMDLQLHGPDGNDYFLNVTGAPIRDEQGNVVKAIVVYRDMTSRRQLERRTQEAIEATRMKSEFLANMSHELRTPLNGIIGFAELMHDGKVGPISEDHQEYLGDILTSARHLQQLINDVLDLAKVEAGKMIFRPEPIDLPRLAGEVSDVIRQLSANRQIAVEIVIDPTLTGIEVDPSKLKQVLYNYLSNAIKFTPEHGKVVDRALPEGELSFRIEVEDSGIGIKPDDVERLFVEFRQLDSTTAKRYQGTGLGLALTKRIIEAQGGRVGVRSDYGRGSVFWATLPRVVTTTMEDRVDYKNQPSLAHINAPTVLIIEDEPSDQSLLAHILDDAGYRIEVATTGQAAIDLCKTRKFDAITLDLFLPDMSGWDALKSIRSQGANHETPIIVVTIIADQGVGAGFAIHDFLCKPVVPEELLGSLERAHVLPGDAEAVLVVDDDPTSLKLMEVTLAQRGYQPICATDGEVGLQLAEQSDISAVVLDLLMPNVDGFEFLRRFNQLGNRHQVPVIIWTNKDLTREDYAQLQSSARAVLQKHQGGTSALMEEIQACLSPHVVLHHQEA